jgi:hypothetical protein
MYNIKPSTTNRKGSTEQEEENDNDYSRFTGELQKKKKKSKRESPTKVLLSGQSSLQDSLLSEGEISKYKVG